MQSECNRVTEGLERKNLLEIGKLVRRGRVLPFFSAIEARVY